MKYVVLEKKGKYEAFQVYSGLHQRLRDDMTTIVFLTHSIRKAVHTARRLNNYPIDMPDDERIILEVNKR